MYYEVHFIKTHLIKIVEQKVTGQLGVSGIEQKHGDYTGEEEVLLKKSHMDLVWL